MRSLRSFAANPSPPSLRSLWLTSSGFTLMEMMMTLIVFILLAAAVFELMSGVLQSAGTLMDNQNRKDQTVALNAYLKKRLGEMPVASTIASYQRGDGEGLTQNGIIFGTATDATAIDATQQPNGLYTLRQTIASTGADDPPQDARQVLQQGVTSNDPTLTWTALVKDIKTIDWKFLDFNQTVWVEVWNSGTNPNLVEFDLQPGGDLQGTTMDFWLPKIDKVQLSAPGTGTSRTGGGSQQPRATLVPTPTTTH